MNYTDIKRLHDELFGPLEVPETGNMLVDDDETKLVDQVTNDEETRMWW